MRERGFIPLSILGSPTVWLALGCALLAFTSWAMYGRWQAAVEREATWKGKYHQLESETHRKGEEAKAKADAEMKRQKEVNNALSKKLKALGAANVELRSHLDRLRQRPIERPDGSTVPVTTIGPAGATGEAGAERVSVEDYRALEARAAYDAQTVMLWREWATAQGLMK